MNAAVPTPEVPPRVPLRERFGSIPIRTQRFLALSVVVLAGMTLIPWPWSFHGLRYELGRVQPSTVIADFDFPVLKEPLELERERAARADDIPAEVMRSDSASATAYARLDELREKVRILRTARGRGDVLLPLSQETLVPLLVGDNSNPLLHEVEDLLQDVMQRGFVSPDLAGQLTGFRSIRVRDPLGDVIVPREQLLTPERVSELARTRAAARGVPAEALAEIVLFCAVPNLVFDPTGTTEMVDQAVASVDPSAGRVLKGEKIIGAHERITGEKLRVLRSYEYWRHERGGSGSLLAAFLPVLGRLLVLLLALGLFVAYIRLNRPELLEHPGDFWLLALLESLVLVSAAVLVRALQLPPTLVPVATVSILVTLLFDEQLALAASMLPVLLVAVLAGAGSQFIVVIGAGAIATVLLTHAVRQRAQFFQHLSLLPAIHVGMLAAVVLVDSDPLAGLLRDGAVVAANPLLSAALALFLLPHAEAAFGRCSDISLREFQDLNRPLLRRLMMGAPGTYHHSILVGALAESAALVSAANPVLARVIGMYHDIGKIAKPEYFPENIGIGVRNPHDKLAPSMTRLILESHIRDGVALAREERLPRPVIEGIREHHGISVMDAAWRKARKQDPAARQEEYRYPGPRPTRRESALVLLANEVEQAARGLENPTPSRIKGLVHRVVQDNLESWNLDDSGLSLSDIARVRDSFVPILAAAFRGRVQSDRGNDDANLRENPSRRGTDPRGRR